MNCANHSERTATAFCQNCGKALCPECTRNADGLVLCEPCLLARATAHGAASPGWADWSTSPPPGANPPYSGFTPPAAGFYSGNPAYPPRYANPGPSPVLAGLLGVIPGVGAMYNGQFIKALIHVVVFVVLIGITTHFGPGGILIAAWIIYQIFDAAHTASARRDGRPVPDPFGIQDLGQRLGPQSAAAQASYTPPSGSPSQPGGAPTEQTATAEWTAQTSPSNTGPWPDPSRQSSSQPYSPPYAQNFIPGYSQVPPSGYGRAADGRWVRQPYAPGPAAIPPAPRRSEPVGAIVLIVLGVLFLCSTLGVFHWDWIGRGWPILLLGLGIWLLVRRASAPAAAPLYPPAQGAAPRQSEAAPAAVSPEQSPVQNPAQSPAQSPVQSPVIEHDVAPEEDNL